MKNNSVRSSLRQSILKAVLQGKLCKNSYGNSQNFFFDLVKAGHREKDFSAIVHEKNKYYEINGKNKKDISNEIPFVIPNNWIWCRFEDLCNFRIGKTPERKNSSYWNSNDIPWVSISDMVDNSHISSTKESISNHAKNDCFSFEPFKVGSMLMSFKLTIGKTSIVDIPCYCNEAIMQFEPFIDNPIFKSYLFLFIGLLSKEIKVTNAIKGSTLNKKKLSKMLIPLPPLEEQERIVAKIKKLEPLIEQYEEEKEKRSALDFELLQKLRLSILKAAIEGNLTKHNLLDLSAKSLVRGIRKEKEELIKVNGYKKDKDAIDMESIEMPFVKPTNWEWIRLGDLGFFKKGPFGSDLTKDIFVDKGKDTIKVYEQQNAIKKDWKLGTYYITKDYYDKKMYLYKTDPGDIIVSCVGTIGEAYLIPNDAPSGIINTALLRIKLTKKINVQYFLLYFDCVLKNLSNKQSKGVAIKGIPTLKKLTNMLVAIPPLEEQEKIVEKVKNLYSKIDELLVK